MESHSGQKWLRIFYRSRNISVGREIFLSDEKSVSSDEKYFCRLRNLLEREIFWPVEKYFGLSRMFLSLENFFVLIENAKIRNGPRITNCGLRTGKKKRTL